MDRIEHTMEFDKEVLNPRLEQKITYKMHSVEKNQPFDPLCHRHPLFLVNQAPEKDIEYPKYAPVHGRFTKFPELKNGRWKTISIQPDFRQYMEDKPNNFQYMEHAETSTILSRHKRQMPTYSKQLHHVGLFIAAHKYFGIDGRKMSDKSRIFYKSFPVPPLKKMDSKLDGPCRESAVKCILAIHKVILSPGTSSLYPLLHHTVPPLNWPGFYPFKSWATMFEFRATASYFMCWYTMKRDEIMAHFMKGKNCLLYLNRLQESRKSGITVFDWRTDDHNKPFSCAEIMFCPNPCYGRRTGGSIPSAKFMLHDVGNPCREFKDNTCRLIPKNNMDLMVSGYELIYFSVRGRGQSIRYLLEDNNLTYTETNCGPEFQTKWKPKMPFGQVPCLIDGGFEVVQSNAILRHLGRKHDLYGTSENEATRIDVLNDGVEDIRGPYQTMIYTNYENGKDAFVKSLPAKLTGFKKLLDADTQAQNGFAVGGKVSFVDYNLFDILEILKVLSPHCLDEFPSLEAYFQAFLLNRPGIQKTRNTDKFKNMPINGNGKQ